MYDVGLDWVGTASFSRGLGWVAKVMGWVGLSWVIKNGPMYMSGQETLKEDLEVMGIDCSDKTTAASDRANWRRIVDQCFARN